MIFFLRTTLCAASRTMQKRKSERYNVLKFFDLKKKKKICEILQNKICIQLVYFQNILEHQATS